jgi:glucokinase
MPQESPDILIGVDLGYQFIRTGAISPAGEMIDFRRERQNSEAVSTSGRALVDQMLSAVEGLIKDHSAKSRILAIGVGFPGLVEHATCKVVHLPHAPSLAGFDFRGEFEKKFGVPIYLENNANAMAYAEMQRGVAKGESDWLYLYLGAGVGAGLVLDGKLRRGKSGFAGEIGHVNIDPEGLECACGSFGCLETVASAPNIVRRTRLRLHRDGTSSLSRLGAVSGFGYDDVVNAANNGDDLAKMMLDRTGHFIGRAVAGVINLLNLSLVAVGGSPAARPRLVSAISAETRRRAFAHAYNDCRIVAAELGEEACVTGAALLAQKSI